MSHKRYRIAIVVVFVVIVLAGAAYEWLVPGLSSARTVPPKLEIAIATWLLHQSVPAQAQKQVNPLGADAADIVAGRDLFRENCEVCHAYDGGGHTRIGGREYPHAPPLRVAVRFDVGRRGVLSHPQRHQKHGDASLGHAGPADLATRRLYPSPAESGADGCRGASGERPRWAGACCDLCRLGHVQEMPRGNLRALEQIENGERGARSARASRRDHSRFLQARSARHFHQGRYRVRLRQPLEAALFHQDRRRLFPRAGAMGRHAQDVEEVFRPQRHRLVGDALSAGQFQAADRPAVRRLPFGRLRHCDQESKRMERRLREMPRPGQRACRAAGGEHHPQPGPLRLRARQRHLHPMSFAGPAAEESDRGQVL